MKSSDDPVWSGFMRLVMMLVYGLSCWSLAGPVRAVPLPPGVEPKVLLITDETLAEAWEPFARFKTRLGYPTQIVTVQQIVEPYEGDDVQARIRAGVLDSIEQRGVRYVILGGDSGPRGTGLVPDRDTLHPQMRYRDIPTDLYYLSPGESDWDANGDGVFGDWRNDREAIAYGHPTGAAIGRIPVRTPADVAAYTDKIIAYETRYPTRDFARRMIYSNTVNGSEPKVRRSWDDYLSGVWGGGEALRFLHTQTHWDKERSGDFALNTTNWLKVINDQTAGKMHMHGHGHLPGWVLEHRTGNTFVDAQVVAQLTNQDAYLVMTTVSCFTGQFDSARDPSIVEYMLRTPRRGAVLIIAPSREGVPMFHDPRHDFRLMVTEGKLDGTTETMTRFWMNGLSPDELGRYRTAGQAFMRMKQEMTPHAERTEGYHWCQSELNLLGDPTLDLRADDPISPAMDLPEAIAVEPTELVIRTGLTDRPGARVTLWKAEEVYQSVEVDEQGVARVTLEVKTPGDLLVTVSGPSVNAVLATIRVE